MWDSSLNNPQHRSQLPPQRPPVPSPLPAACRSVLFNPITPASASAAMAIPTIKVSSAMLDEDRVIIRTVCKDQ